MKNSGLSSNPLVDRFCLMKLNKREIRYDAKGNLFIVEYRTCSQTHYKQTLIKALDNSREPRLQPGHALKGTTKQKGLIPMTTKFSFAPKANKEASIVARSALALPFDWAACVAIGKKGEVPTFEVPVAFWTDERGETMSVNDGEDKGLTPTGIRDRIKTSFNNYRASAEKALDGKFLGFSCACQDIVEEGVFKGTLVELQAQTDADRKVGIERAAKAQKAKKKSAKAKPAAKAA